MRSKIIIMSSIFILSITNIWIHHISRPIISATSAGFFSRIYDQVLSASFFMPLYFFKSFLIFYCYFYAFITVYSSTLLSIPFINFYFFAFSRQIYSTLVYIYSSIYCYVFIAMSLRCSSMRALCLA